MTLTETLEKALAEAGIVATETEAPDGSPRFVVSDDVSIEVMLDIVALGGKPYVVFHPGVASPHMDTGADVVAYLRKENLL